MRPSAPEPISSNLRKPPMANHFRRPHYLEESYNDPESFFLTRSNEMERPLSSCSGRPQDNTYGVQSMEDSMKCGDESYSPLPDSKDNATGGGTRPVPPLLHRMSTIKPTTAGDAGSSRPSSLTFGHSHAPEITPSLTPLLIGSPAVPGSLTGSPKSTSTRSFRRCDEISISDAASSHAVESSDEDDTVHSTEPHDSAPQLVMPSIRMPSRRPFTDRGKSLGRLKLMIAGGPGKVQDSPLVSSHSDLLTQKQ